MCWNLETNMNMNGSGAMTRVKFIFEFYESPVEILKSIHYRNFNVKIVFTYNKHIIKGKINLKNTNC